MRSFSNALWLALAGNAIASPIETRQAASCKAMMVVFARGTSEQAPIGSIVGPPLKDALASKVGDDMDFAGVDYAADVQGFLAGGDKAGSKAMAQQTMDAISQCPQSSVVMVGYSQGGQLVHNAADQLGDMASQVSAAVIFGDPNNGDPVGNVDAASTKIFCNDDDKICDGTAIIRPAHLAYGENADEAADFIMSAAGGAAGAAAATNGTAAAAARLVRA